MSSLNQVFLVRLVCAEVMSTTYSCDRVPLLKVLLHCSKYPHASVNGVLLGRTSKGSNSVEITDAIPLFHTCLTLAPMLEVALGLIETHCSGSDDLNLVGYYHAEAHMLSTEFPQIGKQIADKIASKYPNSVALVVDNKKLVEFTSKAEACPFDLLVKDNNRNWKKASAGGAGTLTLSSGSWLQLRDEYNLCRNNRLAQSLHDFDEHFDDAAKDYLNPNLLQ